MNHHFIRDALDNYPNAQESFTQMARRDWAVRVLDAWAESDPDAEAFRTGRGEPDESERWCCWTIDAPTKRKYFYGPTPDTARLAAADAVWPELPESVRAELGERP